jgi:predicted permease
MIEAIRHDIRYACRWLLRSPGFAVVAMLSLGLGIGANTAIFAVLDAMLLRPLPVADPSRLVDLYTSGADGDAYSTNSVPDLQDFSARATTVEGIAAYTPMFAPVTSRERTRLAFGEIVSGNYFQVFGIPAQLGRTLLPEDDVVGAPATVVISEALWRREFAADPGVVGRALRIRGTPHTIVGVIGSAFPGMVPLLAPEMWVALSRFEDIEPAGINEVVPSPTGTNRLTRRGQRWLFAKARLKPGVSVDQARAELQVLAAQIAAANQPTNRTRRVTVRATSLTRVHPELDGLLTWILSGTMLAVGLVLLIACANVAGMLLARASAREREISIRLALGAGRGRLVQQLLVESVILGGAGGAVGIALAWWLTRALASMELPIPFPISLNLHIDARVLGFSLAAALATGIVAGLAPALRSTRVDLMTALKGNLTGARAAGRRWTLRDGLVVGQMAVTTLLLVMAGLLLRSLMASQHADVGFKSDGLALVSTDTQLARYSDERGHQFFDEAMRRVRALPGVESVALASRLPFSLNFNRYNIAIPDHQKSPDEMGASIDSSIVSPEYFGTIGLGIVQGRGFVDQDQPKTPPVVVINETMARQYWPAGNAIGQRVFERTLSSGHSFEIVGIVADHKTRTVGESSHPSIYFATAQRWQGFNVLVARTRGDEHALLDAMRRTALEIDPSLLLIDRQTMRDQMSAMLFPVRAAAALVTVFGAVGLLLAAIGLYGVIAFSVARRAREIGIRVAIGARPNAVLGLIMRQGLTLALIGLVTGGVLAAAATRIVAGALYGIRPSDPVSWGIAALVLLTVAALANFIPAQRAMRLDPSRVLRSE